MQCHPGGPQDGCFLPPKWPLPLGFHTVTAVYSTRLPAPIPSCLPHLALSSGSSCPGSTVSRTGRNLPYQGGQASVDVRADTFPLGWLSVCVEASLGGREVGLCGGVKRCTCWARPGASSSFSRLPPPHQVEPAQWAITLQFTHRSYNHPVSVFLPPVCGQNPTCGKTQPVGTQTPSVLRFILCIL